MGSGSSLALPISGNIISSIEKQTSLKRKYLTDFEYSLNTSELTECDAFREKGVSGVLHRLTKPDSDNSSDSDNNIEKPKKERNKVQKFFDNLFGKKKRKQKKNK